MIYIIYT